MSVVHDPDRLARFEREARVLAALNHPLIAHVYGFEQSGDIRAIVMELVEGATLEERSPRGRSLSPMRSTSRGSSPKRSKRRTSSASSIAISSRPTSSSRCAAPPPRAQTAARAQTSAADLEDCLVKVLDFGLAKALDRPRVSADALNSPTLTRARPSSARSSEPPPTWRPSRRAARPSTGARTSGRSVSCSRDADRPPAVQGRRHLRHDGRGLAAADRLCRASRGDASRGPGAPWTLPGA